jgi:hypothetical protein
MKNLTKVIVFALFAAATVVNFNLSSVNVNEGNNLQLADLAIVTEAFGERPIYGNWQSNDCYYPHATQNCCKTF